MGAAVAVCVAMLLRSDDVDVINAAQKASKAYPTAKAKAHPFC